MGIAAGVHVADTPLQTWLAEVKERLAKATPGPWINGRSDGSRKASSDAGATISKKINCHSDEDIVAGGMNFDEMAAGVLEAVDAEFIAHSPTDLTKAVRIIEELILQDTRYMECSHDIGSVEEARYEAGKIAAMTEEQVWG